MLAVFVIPRGVPAAIAAMVAGIGGILTCIGVNAGGPGERAGARVESANLEKVRPPQGDWPPYDEDRVIEGEVVPPAKNRPPAA